MCLSAWQSEYRNPSSHLSTQWFSFPSPWQLSPSTPLPFSTQDTVPVVRGPCLLILKIWKLSHMPVPRALGQDLWTSSELMARVRRPDTPLGRAKCQELGCCAGQGLSPVANAFSPSAREKNGFLSKQGSLGNKGLIQSTCISCNITKWSSRLHKYFMPCSWSLWTTQCCGLCSWTLLNAIPWMQTSFLSLLFKFW